MLGATATRLAAREVEFEVTDAAVALLAELGYEPEYGARPLRRVIQREIDDRISDLFVSGALGDGEGVRVDAADGAFVVVPVPRATVELPPRRSRGIRRYRSTEAPSAEYRSIPAPKARSSSRGPGLRRGH